MGVKTLLPITGKNFSTFGVSRYGLHLSFLRSRRLEGCITVLGVSSDHLSIKVYDKVSEVSLLPKAVKKTFSVTKAVYCRKAVFLDMLKLKQFFHISQFSMPSSTLMK